MTTNKKKEIINAAKRLYQKDFLASCDGNISMRLADGNILITPSGCQKAFMSEDQMALCTKEGIPLKGTPSSETAMHIAVYQQCPEAQAVVHAHPPYVIAWSLAKPEQKFLPVEKIPELLLALGSCPVVPYAVPGTKDMAEVLTGYLPENRAFILKFHGGLSWGETLSEALGGIERMEHAVKILTIAESLGGPKSLPPQSLEKLRKIREKIHPKIL